MERVASKDCGERAAVGERDVKSRIMAIGGVPCRSRGMAGARPEVSRKSENGGVRGLFKGNGVELKGPVG